MIYVGLETKRYRIARRALPKKPSFPFKAAGKTFPIFRKDFLDFPSSSMCI